MVDRILRLDITLPVHDIGGLAVGLTLSEVVAGGTTFFSGSIAQEFAFADLAGAFGVDLSAVPSALLPTIKDAAVVLERSNKLFVLLDTNHTTTALVVDEASTSKDYLASLRTNLSIALSDLPVIDSVLPSSLDAGLSAFAVLAASKDFAKADLEDFNQLLTSLPGSVQSPFSPRDIAKGKMLSADLNLGGNVSPLALPFESTSEAKARATRGTSLVALATNSGAAPMAKWHNVQKSIGPLNIKRVGLGYQAGKLWLMLDAGFMMAGLDVELIGARIGFAPHWPPDLSPAIDGLALTYQNGAIAVSGGLTAIGRDRFDGQLMVSAETFVLTALASYTKVQGAASLFAFAVLDTPLGGPPFCFVTGVAAGFGLNRDLKMPGLEGVRDFPLVQAINGGSTFAGKTDPAQALTVMGELIPPRYGENWLALGIRFTTFELLKSVALVTARFGPDVEIDLLGFSTLSVPSDAGTNPIGYAELALLASFRPAEGTLRVNGQLTPASHVLSPDCHLVGGFAIWAWFKDNGPARAGDFVVTLGGYHPAFNVSWYPAEPRIGANWQVTGELLIKGGFYFALTPSAVMAGGFVDATWSSGDISAWFSAHADFLLSWKPFYYQASVGIDLGASFTLDLLITSVTMTIHVGVDLDFHGPDFSGHATIHLSIISFGISFGDSGARRDPIGWKEFKTSFLPRRLPDPQPGGTLRALTETAADTAPLAVCMTRVSKGLIKDLTRSKAAGTHPDWVINPEKLELVTSAAFPSKQVTLKIGGVEVAVPTQPAWNTSFGIGPMGIADSELTSVHLVEISRVSFDPAGVNPPREESVTLQQFRIAPTAALNNVPQATWSTDAAFADDPAKILSQTTRTIDGAVTGVVLAASAEDPDITPLAMDLGKLQFDPEPPQVLAPYHTQPVSRTDDPGQDSDRMTAFVTGLSADAAVRARNAIVTVLAGQELIAENSAIDLTKFAAGADVILLSAPTLAFLGEESKKTGVAAMSAIP